MNHGGAIVGLNVQAEKQFGYQRDELLGPQVTRVIPEGFAEMLRADGLRSTAAVLAQHIGTGSELTGRKDGGEILIEIILGPLERAGGILVTATIRNITTHKKAETHLAQMEGRRRIGEEALRESEGTIADAPRWSRGRRDRYDRSAGLGYQVECRCRKISGLSSLACLPTATTALHRRSVSSQRLNHYPVRSPRWASS